MFFISCNIDSGTYTVYDCIQKYYNFANHIYHFEFNIKIIYSRSLNSFKYFIVITDKPEEIKNYIIKTLHHGATSNMAIGEFTSSEKTMIHTVCKRIEAIKLKSTIKTIDAHAFIIVTTTSEIIGRGFRSV